MQPANTDLPPKCEKIDGIVDHGGASESIPSIPQSESSFSRQVHAKLRQCLRPAADESLADAHNLLAQAAQNLCLAPSAKHIRPQLTRLFAQAAGVEEQRVVDAAVAAELIHCGSLLHDDVIDGGTMRRGRPCANALWGNAAAVLAGDHVLCVALRLLRAYPPALTQQALATVRHMTASSAAELAQRGRLEGGLDRWRHIAVGKTGALFAWCASVGAWLLQCDGRLANAGMVERCTRCAHHLGVAFQLTDDLLDLLGTGGLKDRFCDIRNREPSYPLLLASERFAGLRERLETLWQSPDISPRSTAALGQDILRTDVETAAKQAVTTELAAAIAALGPLGTTPGGQALVEWLRGWNP